ncbi:hypothetical protein HD554DRAFT_2177049 [Boletus coccyginus]|nr:hypothetical protein HD554DRAFT_2177049 [Boletus coccyginus]
MLSQPQQRCSNLPTQSRLRIFSDTIYPQPVLSSTTPSTPTSMYTGTDSQFSTGVNAGPTFSSVAVHVPRPDPRHNEVIQYASLALVNDMALNSGWRHEEKEKARNVWKDKVTESLNMAYSALRYDRFIPSPNTDKKIVRALSTFRSRMAASAETYAKEYIQTRFPSFEQSPDHATMQEWVEQSTDPSDPYRFFLHKMNERGEVEQIFGHPTLESFHIDWWYVRDTSPVKTFQGSYHTTSPHMLALSGVALLCGLHRVSEGRCSHQRNVIHFSTNRYAGEFDVYRQGIIAALQDDYYGGEFSSRLKQLHDRGFENMRRNGETSSRGQRPVVLPPPPVAVANIPTMSGPSYSEFAPQNPFYASSTHTGPSSIYNPPYSEPTVSHTSSSHVDLTSMYDPHSFSESQ